MYDESYDKDLLGISQESLESEGEDTGIIDPDSGSSSLEDILKHPRLKENVVMHPFSPDVEHSSKYLDKIGEKQRKKKITSLLKPIYEFFETQRNFDSMPQSNKVIVFDMDISVKDAIKIASENDISYATLWDRRPQKLNGMLTITDLVNIIMHCNNRQELLSNLINTKTIRQWRELQKSSGKSSSKSSSKNDGYKNDHQDSKSGNTTLSDVKIRIPRKREVLSDEEEEPVSRLRKSPDNLISVHPEESLWNSICLFLKHRIHRLPVISSDGSLLHVITGVSVLSHLVRFCNFQLPIFQMSLEDLKIGSFSGVYTCKENQPVYEILDKFSKLGISCVPVIEESGSVRDIYIKNDVVYLLRGKDGKQNIDCTLKEALDDRPKTPLFTCKKSEPFGKTIRHLVGTRIHKLVCVDDNFNVIGIISITDILEFLAKHYQEYIKLKVKNKKEGRKPSRDTSEEALEDLIPKKRRGRD